VLTRPARSGGNVVVPIVAHFFYDFVTIVPARAPLPLRRALAAPWRTQLKQAAGVALS